MLNAGPMSELVESPSPNLPQSQSPFKVLALYKFAELKDCAALKQPLALFCCARKIRGSFILAPEGINGTVAGTPAAIDALLAWFATDPLWRGRLAGAEAKFSTASSMPFLRMKVRLKPEIVTLRAPEADPSQQVGTYVETRAEMVFEGRDARLQCSTCLRTVRSAGSRILRGPKRRGTDRGVLRTGLDQHHDSAFALPEVWCDLDSVGDLSRFRRRRTLARRGLPDPARVSRPGADGAGPDLGHAQAVA